MIMFNLIENKVVMFVQYYILVDKFSECYFIRINNINCYLIVYNFRKIFFFRL